MCGTFTPCRKEIDQRRRLLIDLVIQRSSSDLDRSSSLHIFSPACTYAYVDDPFGLVYVCSEGWACTTYTFLSLSSFLSICVLAQRTSSLSYLCFPLSYRSRFSRSAGDSLPVFCLLFVSFKIVKKKKKQREKLVVYPDRQTNEQILALADGLDGERRLLCVGDLRDNLVDSGILECPYTRLPTVALGFCAKQSTYPTRGVRLPCIRACVYLCEHPHCHA